MIRFASLVLSALLATGAAARAQILPTDTVVECSGAFETVSNETEIVSTFRQNVVATGTNLKLTCDFLRIVALQQKGQTKALGQYGYFKSLVATGHVRIVQGDREATCGRAEIFPGEDKIVLTENPVVRSTDDQYTASGPRMVLYRGRRQAVIEGSPEERVRITLPPLRDLGFEKNETPAPAAPPARPSSTAPEKSAARTHLVSPGETFLALARRYGVSYSALLAANPGLDPDRIRPGQTLRLPAGPRTHLVTRGETLFGIARRYGVEPARIRAANRLTDDRVKIGQTLVIPAR